MGVPGWPLLAFWTASMARQRTVSMQSLSMFVAEKVTALPLEETSGLVGDAGLHEGREERMGIQGLGLELGVELAPQEIRMIGDLHDLHEGAVRAHAREREALLLQGLAELRLVELVAVAVALADLRGLVGHGGGTVAFQHAGIGPEAHGAAQFLHVHQLAQLEDDPVP